MQLFNKYKTHKIKDILYLTTEENSKKHKRTYKRQRMKLPY